MLMAATNGDKRSLLDQTILPPGLGQILAGLVFLGSNFNYESGDSLTNKFKIYSPSFNQLKPNFVQCRFILVAVFSQPPPVCRLGLQKSGGIINHRAIKSYAECLIGG